MIETPGFLWTVLFFLLAIGPLIFVHELGHYLVGRWCGVKADVFSIGFGKEVTGWTDKRGTRWKIGWMPLGGYVRFAGDANAASMPDDEWKDLPDFERSRTFHAKPLWKRALIVAAGPATNFLVAILIYAGMIAVFGEQRTPAVVGGIQAGSAAATAGFKPGDRILSVNDREVDRFTDIARYVELRPGQAMSFEVQRGSETIRLMATPRIDRMVDRFGNKSTRGLLGLASGKPVLVKVPLSQLPAAALRMTGDLLRAIVDGLGQFVTGKRSLTELSGPLMIAKVSGQAAALGWIDFLSFMAFVSINLGFINLLPIPALDGGHLLFYTIEGILRRPVPPKAQEWAFGTGFVALMSLMLFVTINDLASFGLWQRLSGLIG